MCINPQKIISELYNCRADEAKKPADILCGGDI